MSESNNTISQKKLAKTGNQQVKDRLQNRTTFKQKLAFILIGSFIGGLGVFFLFQVFPPRLKSKPRPLYYFDYIYNPRDPNRRSNIDARDEPEHYYRQPLGFEGLFTITSLEIENLDLGIMNLLCAEGLPGAKKLNVLEYSRLLQEWAIKVDEATVSKYGLFNANPEKFSYSSGYFQMLVMTTVLQRELGIKYNPALADRSYKDIKGDRNPEDLFISGPLSEKRTGTCASLPVLYVAIGQILGYPVHLALTSNHVYAKWIAPDQDFNIEITNKGMMCHTDDYYKNWPWKLTQDEIDSGQVNRTLDKIECLALFLNLRANCLLAQENPDFIPDALFASSYAHSLAPKNPSFFSVVMNCINAELPLRRKYDFSENYQGNKILDDLQQIVHVRDPVTEIRRIGNETVYTRHRRPDKSKP